MAIRLQSSAGERVRKAMKLITLPAIAAAAALTLAADAFAQCSFDGPAKAKGFKTSLIRAFASCPCISPCYPVPNSQTGTGVPSCSPPYAPSAYEFDTPSQCLFKMKVKREEPCSNGNPAACTAATFTLSCSGILDPGGATRTNASGFQLSAVIRATVDDPDNGDMTIVNIPISAVLPAADNGRLSATFELADVLLLNPFAPGCAALEPQSIALKDPNGAPFAVVGSGTRP
jgi:hypothetical protein